MGVDLVLRDLARLSGTRDVVACWYQYHAARVVHLFLPLELSRFLRRLLIKPIEIPQLVWPTIFYHVTAAEKMQRGTRPIVAQRTVIPAAVTLYAIVVSIRAFRSPLIGTNTHIVQSHD